jgi:hypothetical protein
MPASRRICARRAEAEARISFMNELEARILQRSGSVSWALEQRVEHVA